MFFQKGNEKNPSPPKSPKTRNPLTAALLLVVLVAIGVVGWKLLNQGKLPSPFKPTPPSVPVEFALEPSDIDAAGISPQTSFILKSTQRLSKKEIKNIVRFTPEVEFKVTDVSESFSMIPTAFAQSEELGVFFAITSEITPEEPLKEDEIYQVIISDPNYVTREYSWAFQVKAEFQVIKTHPGNQTTGVPTNSGIEITFNRENLINPQGYFEISPNVPGTFESYGNTLVFLPNGLAAEIIYTVTIKKGLKTQGSDDALSEDYSFAFETKGKPYDSQDPRFDFYGEFSASLPNKKPVMQVSTYNIASGERPLSADLYKLAKIDEFLSSYQNSRNWELTWGYYYHSSAVSFNSGRAEKVLSFEPEMFKVQWREFMELPAVLDNGYYVLDVYNKPRNEHRYLWLQVSPLSYYYSITYDKGLLWLYDFPAKAPVEGAELASIGKPGQEVSLGKTNSQGLSEFATPDVLREGDQAPQNPRFFKLSKSGYLPLLVKVGGGSGYYYGGTRASQGDPYWDFLATERPAYQISDTVKYWGVVKSRTGDLRQTKVKVGVYQGYFYPTSGGGGSIKDREALVSQEVTVSTFHTIQGELAFQGLSPGYYVLIASAGDKVFSTASIRVLSYTKPAYQISVTPTRKTIFAGDKAGFKVTAKFFDGTPVSKLKVEHTGYWRDSSVGLKGTLVLDENGQGVFSYTPEYYEAKYNYWPKNLNVYFSPTLAEEGDITAVASVVVFGPNMHLQALQEHQGEGAYEFTAKLNEIVLDTQGQTDTGYQQGEYIGEPVASYPLSAELIETTYTKVETGQYFDPIDKVVRKQYRYDKNEAVIKQYQGTTDNSGEWSFTETIPQKENASYRLRFYGSDLNQRKMEVFVYPWQGGPVTSISLKINQEDYQKDFSVGEDVNLALEVPEQLEVADKVLFYRYQNSINGVWVRPGLAFQEAFQEGLIPSVSYQAVVLTSSGFRESNRVTASFKQGDRTLTVDITPDKESYRPGEEIAVNLLVKDRDEDPVSAEVNVAVVDEAMFHILPYSWEEKILDSLYTDIWVRPITGLTQYYEKAEDMLSMPGEGAEMGGCFLAGTSILMADGTTKPIEKVRIGDKVLTFESEQKLARANFCSENPEDSPALVSAVVQGVSAHFVDEYLVINNSLKVTPEHQVYLNEEWKAAGEIKVGDWLKGADPVRGEASNGADGAAVEVFAVERVRASRLRVYNIIVGKYHTYIADNYFVHNEEKGGAPRMDFVDVALYETLRTEKNGKASFSFKAPDNITSWRTTALAFSADEMKAGQNSQLIPVSLPLFVEATLSNYYLVGDRPQVRLRVFGTAYQQDQETEFSLKSESLGIDEAQTSLSNTVHFFLEPLTEGEHEIVASAEQGGLSDALLRKIQVLKSYFRVGESSLYELSEGLSGAGIEANQDGFTRVLFVDRGRGRLYPALRRHTYASGIRIDQVAARHFANELLGEYFEDISSEEPLDLSEYHTEEGGIGGFPYSDSDLELSAKTADLAEDFVFREELKGYFTASLSDKKADVHRISKALYGLACLREPVLSKLNLVKDRQELTFEDKVFIALAFAKLGDKETARVIYSQDIRPALRFQGNEAWLWQEQDQTKQVKLTATIGVLVSYLHYQDSQPLWQYISTHNPQKDLDAFEELLFIRNELTHLPNQSARFSFQTNRRKETVTLSPGQTYGILLSEEELKTIRFSDIEGEIALLSFYERSRDPQELTKNPELGLTRIYLVNKVARDSFYDGEVVLVRLDPKLAQTAIDGPYQIIDYLPSGLKAITQLYKRGLERGDECDPVWFPSKIIDNVVYFNIYKGFNKTQRCSNRTVNYYARVVSGGSYSANPAVLQSAKALESLNISSKSYIEIK